MAERFIWSKDKNNMLLSERGVDFPMVVRAIGDGRLLDDLQHPGPDRGLQRILIVRMKGDVYAIPYVTDGESKFLKTIFPSRKYREIYGEHNG